jgi:hypothetical protein
LARKQKETKRKKRRRERKTGREGGLSIAEVHSMELGWQMCPKHLTFTIGSEHIHSQVFASYQLTKSSLMSYLCDVSYI